MTGWWSKPDVMMSSICVNSTELTIKATAKWHTRKHIKPISCISTGRTTWHEGNVWICVCLCVFGCVLWVWEVVGWVWGGGLFALICVMHSDKKKRASALIHHPSSDGPELLPSFNFLRLRLTTKAAVFIGHRVCYVLEDILFMVYSKQISPPA